MYLTKFLLMKDIDTNATLIINALSGAVDLIGGKEKGLLRRLQEENTKVLLEKDFETKLRERGYLFNSEEEEKIIFRKIVNLFSERPVSLPEFFLCYTYNCNLKCTYCNERHLSSRIKKLKAMQPEQLEAALNVISEIKRKTRKAKEKGVIVLFGGEPLLPINKNLVIRTLNFAKEEGFSVRIVSNGTMIERFRKVLSNYRDIIEKVAISLDGPQNINDQRRKAVKGSSFEQIVKGVNVLLSEGLRVEVRPIVDRENIDFLPELANFMIDQEWTSHKNFSATIAKVMFPLQTARLDYPFEMSSSEFLKQLSTLAKKYPEMAIFGHQWLGYFEPFTYLRELLDDQELVAPKLFGCKAIIPGMYIFGPDNLIYPCLELVGIPQYATEKFYPRFEKFPTRERWRNFNILKWSSKCRKCWLVTLCGGGCSLTYLISRNYHRDDRECMEIKKTLDTYLEINKTKFVEAVT